MTKVRRILMQSKHTWRDGVQTCKHVPAFYIFPDFPADNLQSLNRALKGKVNRRRRHLIVARERNSRQKEKYGAKTGPAGSEQQRWNCY